ncbi:MAG: NACHT domain-containing protein [Thermoguttaceae bacterium]
MTTAEIEPPRPFEAPKTTMFAHPLERADHDLRDYCRAIIAWHGIMRFVGININDEWDAPIDELFVEPEISKVRFVPDLDPSEWPSGVDSLLQAVSRSPRLVLLGDPGSGKSTLISWIAFQLARQPDNPWKKNLGNLIPVLLVLRDLPISRETTWRALWKAFFHSPVTKIPNRDKVEHELENSLQRGQAILMLDGLDEIGDVSVRSALRAAVFEAMSLYPSCRWLLTSRIVGYEEVPFNHVAARASDPARRMSRAVAPSAEEGALMPGGPGEGQTELAYIAPFNDEQISKFTDQWFSRRVSPPDRAIREGRELTAAIRGSSSTVRLARIPQLLTMMALIFRVKAVLPNGRALLYEEIAAAYLKSIDEYRKLRVLGYPLEQKKRWLARVGFEMQLLRKQAVRVELRSEPSEILATGEQVQGWISQAMQESGITGDKQAASEFVDYVSRRSGLLVPRGADSEGQPWFAFAHLSFQEYFAACFLREQLLSPRWAKGKAAVGTQKSDLADYARNAIWSETLFFLFELLGSHIGWPAELLEIAFGADFQQIFPADEQAESAAVLLAQLSIDPHSGLDSSARAAAVSACSRWEIERQTAMDFEKLLDYKPAVLSALLATGGDEQAIVRRELSNVIQEKQASLVSLSGTNLRDLNFLSNLTWMKTLFLDRTPTSDLSALAGLKDLGILYLAGSSVKDLTPIQELEKIDVLNLDYTRVANLRPLHRLSNLAVLFLSGTLIEDLTPLAGLTALDVLHIGSDVLTDITPIENLTRLTSLLIDCKSVTNISILAKLSELDWLFLANLPIKDLSPLSRLAKLTRLRLSNVPVSDLAPIVELPNLKDVGLYTTKVSLTEVSKFNAKRRRMKLAPVKFEGPKRR